MSGTDLKSLIWHYDPSLALCVIAVILFALSTLWHIVQIFKYKQKFFVFFVLGGILQVIGYVARIGCIHDLNNTNYYVVHTLGVLLAPIFYAISIYSLLGKIINYIGADDLSPIRPSRITCIFVVGDLLSFLMQSTGGGMMSSGDPDKTDTGNTIIEIGLVIQLIFFFFFIFLTVVFHRRTRDWGVKDNEGDWKRLLSVLEISSALIFIRSIYRVVEYAQGFDGYLISHEVYLYLLDTLMMFLVQLIYNLFHPGVVLYEGEQDTRDVEMGYIPKSQRKTVKTGARRN